MPYFDVYVVGCGGIGGYVLDSLPQVMACLQLDKLNDEETQHEVLEAEGLSDQLDDTSAKFSKLVLIDGDTFSGHNALRQAGTNGSKLAVQMHKIREKDAFTTWLHTTKLVGYNTYINPDNIGQIMQASGGYPVIFLCVDNHKTRYEVTRWVEDNLPTALIINGGNQKTTGNVTIYQKKWSDAFDPPIYKIYPEVNDKTDRRPDEIHCDEVHIGNDQTALINEMIATVMLNMFRKYVMANGHPSAFNQKLRQKGKNGETLYQRKNEVLIDLENNTMMSLSHAADTDNRRVPVAEVANELPENAEIN